MAEAPVTVSRWKVAVAALACFAIAGGLWFVQPERLATASVFLRVGIVMGAVWLAMPTMAWSSLSPSTFIWLTVFAYSLSQKRFGLIPVLLLIAALNFFFKRSDRATET